MLISLDKLLHLISIFEPDYTINFQHFICWHPYEGKAAWKFGTMVAGSQKISLVAKSECPGPSRHIEAPNQCTVACPLRTTGVFALSLTEKLKENEHQDQPKTTAVVCTANKTSESMKIRSGSRNHKKFRSISELCIEKTHHIAGHEAVLDQRNSVHLYKVSSRVECRNSRGPL